MVLMGDGEKGARALNAARPSSDVDLSEIVSAWSSGSKAGTFDYIALGYAAGSKKKLSVLGSGLGGYAALRAHLLDDALVYSAFKCSVGGSVSLPV